MNPKLDALKLAMTVPEQHQRKVAEATLKMPDAMAGVMGGPSKAEAAKIVAKCPKCGHEDTEDGFKDWRKRNHGVGNMFSTAEAAVNTQQDSHADNRVAYDKLAKEEADLPGDERWITKRQYADQLQPGDKVFLPPNTVLVVKRVSNLGGKAWRKGSKNDGIHIEWTNGGNEQYSPNDMVDVVTGERKKLVMKGAE